MQDKKDVSISVCLKEGIKLIAPAGIDSLKLQSILYKKSPWIIKKKYELEEVLEPASPKEFVSGEKFAYLGRYYRLKVNINENIHTPTLTFKQGRFIAEIPNNITDEERTSNLKPLKKFIERKKEVDYLLYVDDQLLFITIRI
ncbi:YgjP-like metallopeptidase domain-containing protein [Metabacillus litoralis]|uniref:YgjP-like metallopeptidase domain-containing protein n=1 Tax=Metabacillus litoralis TaxID=152268 RepID=UPI00293182AD|nr:YgjP-like metallopeptidase domain-containing protein [Metabacillus litoralis]